MEPLAQLELAGKRLDLHTDESGRLCFSVEAGETDHPVCVLSWPKAGTYYVAQILENLGLVNTECHVGLDGFTDYRGLTIDEKLRLARTKSFAGPLELTSGLVLPGQFIVGHLPRTWRSVRSLKLFRKVLLVRCWRECLVSFRRFERRRVLADPGRLADRERAWVYVDDECQQQVGFMETFADSVTKSARDMIAWSKDDEILTIRHEQLNGSQGADKLRQCVRGMADHLGIVGDFDCDALIARTRGTPTLTRNDQPSRIDDCWSTKAEDIFVSVGGAEVNKLMGYDGH